MFINFVFMDETTNVVCTPKMKAVLSMKSEIEISTLQTELELIKILLVQTNTTFFAKFPRLFIFNSRNTEVKLLNIIVQTVNFKRN